MPGRSPGGFPYPLGTDKVVDGDNAIRSLAEAMRIWSVAVTLPAPTGSAVYRDYPITFPVGLFTVPPVVVANGIANTSGTALVLVPITNTITVTGCTLRAVLSTGATWGSQYIGQVIAFQNPPA